MSKTLFDELRSIRDHLQEGLVKGAGYLAIHMQEANRRFDACLPELQKVEAASKGERVVGSLGGIPIVHADPPVGSGTQLDADLNGIDAAKDAAYAELRDLRDTLSASADQTVTERVGELTDELKAAKVELKIVNERLATTAWSSVAVDMDGETRVYSAHVTCEGKLVIPPEPLVRDAFGRLWSPGPQKQAPDDPAQGDQQGRRITRTQLDAIVAADGRGWLETTGVDALYAALAEHGLVVEDEHPRGLVRHGYGTLYQILMKALDQAQTGKGKVRHGHTGRTWDEQGINAFPMMLGSIDPQCYQIVKKATEISAMVKRGDLDLAEEDALGIIVYAASAIHQIWERR